MSVQGGLPSGQEISTRYRLADYPAFAVTADLAVFTIRTGVLCVLLVQQGASPYHGYWALPGGFVRADESAEEAAYRELGEEIGAATFGGHMEQLRTYSDPGRDPRMRSVSVAHVALAPQLPDPQPGSGTIAARWWPVEELNLDDAASPDAPALAFDHTQILADALERVRGRLEYTTLAARFVEEPFTLADLRRVYAAVWRKPPDFDSFRRAVLGAQGFVVEVAPGSEDGVARNRQPPLYRRGSAAVLHPPMRRPPPAVADGMP
jgi:8-oxo-dGTP diphosphatase